jgi:Flp pilus assembly protein TadD
MRTERVLVIVGSVLGIAWAVDAWVLPRVVPGVGLLIGSYPWVGWLALAAILVAVAFWVGRRIGRKGKSPPPDSQPSPIVPTIPQGARRVETVTDYPRPGVTRTITTVEYVDGLPNTPDLQRRNLFKKANNLYKNHKYEEAIPLFYELLSQPYSDAEETALHITIGNSLANLSKFNEAEDHYEKALEKARKHTDKKGEAAGLVNLAGIYIIKGMLAKALEYSEEALKINREIGDRSKEASSLDNIGIIYGIKWELNKAINYIEQSMKIYKEIGDQEGEVRALINMGIIYKKADKIDEAVEQYQQALKISKKIGDLDAEASALGNMGIAYKAKGELDIALELYQQSLKISKK